MAETASGNLIQLNAGASTESDHDNLVINIKRTIESSKSPSSDMTRCIYKVPDHLRQSNEKSFTPQLISIGPLHHSKKNLRTMGNYKVTYLREFIQRAPETKLEDLVSIVGNSEGMVRECYAEVIKHPSCKFVEMILQDAIFIIEYFLQRSGIGLRDWRYRARTVIKPRLYARMQLDFLLLENQLPFFIIKKLYDKVLLGKNQLDNDPVVYPPFIEVTLAYFDNLNTKYCKPQECQILHFVDLLRSCYIPDPQECRRIRYHDNLNQVEEMYCASQLAEAGLVFKKSANRRQLALEFKDGVLEIPCFTLDKRTELYARNLMALEQLHDYGTAYITDYFRFLDFLIDTDKDVSLLRRKKILVNRLGDDCATIVNNLCSNDVVDTPMNWHYNRICRQLVHFYDKPWHSWKVKLRRDLSTPWVLVTTTSAIFLLGLTLVQTVCTIISTVK